MAPSYSRPTASSVRKANKNQIAKTKDADTTQTPSTPEKIKRPSMLTPQKRDNLTYKRNLHAIKPNNISAPCPLATLPSELRSLIYKFHLQQQQPLAKPRNYYYSNSASSLYSKHIPPPPILHTCRAIRIEASYIYYTTHPFTFTIRNLDFRPLTTWVEDLPKPHRVLLSRNKGLEIDILPRLTGGGFTSYHAPKRWLTSDVDDMMEQDWRACAAFGNLYNVHGDVNKRRFLLFCRLAGWWVWCDKPGKKHLNWRYTFDEELETRMDSDYLTDTLEELVEAVALPCLMRVWTRNREKVGVVAVDARRWLDQLDEWYRGIGKIKERDRKRWRDKMKAGRQAVAKWGV